MNTIARVVVDVALDREFDYRIPAALAGRVAVGSRVSVPFGRRHVSGYVVGLAERSEVPRLKAVAALTEPEPLITRPIVELASWMADYYVARLEQSVRTVLPGAVRRHGARFKTQLFVEPVPGADPETGALTEKQRQAWECLKAAGGAFLETLAAELGLSTAPVHALKRKGLVRIEPRSELRRPTACRAYVRTEPLPLMPGQAEALRVIDACMEADAKPRTTLLHGVTGSGKTEVYMQAIARVLERGQAAIVLVPEISLTPQTVERFAARFGERIAVLHSHLSDGERHDEWHRIRDGRADVVVGARSAVFAPVRRLGLIVVDEEHEPSYKQDEAPRYHARDVAVMRGHRERCAVVLGSATPALESWHNVRRGKYRLATLDTRADNRKMPAVRVVDMRVEARGSGRPGVFSRELVEAIGRRLDRAEQTMLFLNRRGYSTSLLCPLCGHVAACDQCSVAFTYHRSDERLRCHICGADRPVPARCAGCGDPGFRFAGVGTQRVEAIARKCFPKANVARLDTDVTRRKDAYERILGDFRAGKINILIGTQMIAKGLHFPNVTLVGVVYADLSLHMPDFRAGERTFQLLAQVAGRAGRGEVAGEVIVQTFTPFHWAIQAARRLDYKALCDQEFAFREELKYPPFGHLACVTFRGPSEARVRFVAETVAARVRERAPASVIVAEPAPAPLAKARGQYRYHLVLRCASTRRMTGPLSEALSGFQCPRDVTVSVDVDAVNLM
jgi:primosomal protein N' (replication factor Y)